MNKSTFNKKGWGMNNTTNIKKNIQINAGGIKSFYLNFKMDSNSKLDPKEEKSEYVEKKSTKTKKSKRKQKKKKSEILESSSSMIEENIPQKEEVILDDYELNHLPYLNALELDKRNCCQIYCSILKRDHLIIHTFCSKND